MARHIKKGDMVEIMAGDHKGAKGKVLRVIPDEDRVIIQGRNVVKKHVRPSRQNPQGGRIEVEQPIHISNVLPVNPKTNRGTRVKFKIEKDGTKKRIGVDGSELGVTKKAKK